MAEHKTIYEFTVKDADGKDVSLSKYKGQVVIVVNVASKCGYTHGHYTELKQLQDKYYNEGLRVAAFPCNQFGGQEPACELDIMKFVKDTYNYEPDLYAKVSHTFVKPPSADVICKQCRNRCESDPLDLLHPEYI
ncbi:glutathione peroxidase [Cooperia oncophora]